MFTIIINNCNLLSSKIDELDHINERTWGHHIRLVRVAMVTPSTLVHTTYQTFLQTIYTPGCCRISLATLKKMMRNLKKSSMCWLVLKIPQIGIPEVKYVSASAEKTRA